MRETKRTEQQTMPTYRGPYSTAAAAQTWPQLSIRECAPPTWRMGLRSHRQSPKSPRKFLRRFSRADEIISKLVSVPGFLAAGFRTFERELSPEFTPLSHFLDR